MAARLATRGFVLDTEKFAQLEAERKTIQTRTQELQAKRNATSRQIGQAKAKGEDVSAIMAEVASLGDELKQAEIQLGEVQSALQQLLELIPNTPHGSVPVGKSEADNLEVRRVGNIPQVRFCGKGPRRSRRKTGAGFRYRREDFRCAFLGAEGRTGTAASRARAVHAGHAHRAARLHRDLCALPGECRFDARHRAVAEVRGRFVQSAFWS